MIALDNLRALIKTGESASVIIQEVEEVISEINDDHFNLIHSMEMEHQEEVEMETQSDDPEDCRRSLFFALQELKEGEQRGMSIGDIIRDLELRYCRFI